MNLAAEYEEQFSWRPWNRIFDEVPLQAGQIVLDLGCGVGDQARELASRGCKVIGLEVNQELIDAAVLKRLPNCEFRLYDLRGTASLDIKVDGIWSSFVAAYFTNLTELLSKWAYFLRDGGWIAITEIENLFGHEPLSSRTRSLFQLLAKDALAAGRYDFDMGGKLQGCLEQVGFNISKLLTPQDQELSFDGAATPQVIDAWRRRFQRMPHLKALCGLDFASVQEEFLSCLSRPDHVSTAKVVSCIATKIGSVRGESWPIP
jgi:SAM-dependent methyltransferase